LPGYDVAGGVDQHDGRPGPHGEGLPDLEVGVVGDRVLEAQPRDRRAQGVAMVLGRKLARVDAEDDEILGELLTKPAQLADVVVAIDSTGGPELEEDEATGEVGEANRVVGVHPVEGGGKLGGAGAASVGKHLTSLAARGAKRSARCRSALAQAA
jgi:hypothetical protein